MHHHARALRAPLLCALVLASSSVLTASPVEAAAPKISGTPGTTATVGKSWSFQPKASDADGNKLTFSITNRPAWASFSSSNGKLSGTPMAEHARTYKSIVISVSDGSKKVSLPAFSLVVRPNSNKSPTISGKPGTSATVGKGYSFQPSAKDPEGKALKFSIKNRPSWASFNTSTGKLSGTPKATGKFASIAIIASDGVSSASLPSFTITVNAASGNSAPTITGSPASAATVGAAYSFQPTAKDSNGDTLKFSIANKPAWASFNTGNGKLSGTPSASYVGTTSGIKISVSDGKATASLGTFSITVKAAGGGDAGAATLSWTPPTTNTDGSTLTNLAGYRISYGKSASALNQTVQIGNPGLSSYVIEGLSAGKWYFTIRSYTSSGTESPPSNVASRSIQ